MDNYERILITLAFCFLVLGILSLVFREIVCWYWKINRCVALLTEIRDLLANTTREVRRPDLPIPAADEAKESPSADKNLAASGHSAPELSGELQRSAAELSKELQKWRGLSQIEADALAVRVKTRP